MRIIISPAKKMVEDPDTFLPEGLPAFLPEAERLLSAPVSYTHLTLPTN